MTASRGWRFWRWALGATLLAMVAGGVGWAGAVMFAPAHTVLDTLPYTTFEVRQDEVGSSISLNTVATWTPVPVGTNYAAGVVTDAGLPPGTEVSQGTVLYSVNLRPVVVAQGSTPTFRPIAGGDSGPDVAQLQAMLAARGLYHWAVNGKADGRTVSAIRAWQKTLGLQPSGTVGQGDVIFVPSLPTRVALDSKTIYRGASLAGGEQVVQGLPVSPTFTIPVTKGQAVQMPTGTKVEITSPKGERWNALAAEQVTDPQTGNINVQLKSNGSQPTCGDACGEVSVTGQTELSSRIVTVPMVRGLVVPSAALVTTASKDTAVVTAGGKVLKVVVTASARGMSVIQGVKEGQKVRVPYVAGP